MDTNNILKNDLLRQGYILGTLWYNNKIGFHTIQNNYVVGIIS